MKFKKKGIGQVVEITSESVLTSHQVGRLLQVSRRSVNNWIEQGRLTAFRTPGGHRRVRVPDLVAFLVETGFPIPEDLSPFARRRIIVVDDDRHQLRAYGRLLAPYEDVVELRLMERGIDALLMIGSFLPDLVVLDIVLPGLDGVEVCRRIKAGERTRHIDIVVCSGNVSPGVEAAVREAGARSCLRKPIDSCQLIRELGLAELSHPLPQR
ncbi:MAG: response regulator [Polyangiaceae bacterium]